MVGWWLDVMRLRVDRLLRGGGGLAVLGLAEGLGDGSVSWHGSGCNIGHHLPGACNVRTDHYRRPAGVERSHDAWRGRSGAGVLPLPSDGA